MRPYAIYYLFTLITGFNTSQEGPDPARDPHTHSGSDPAAPYPDGPIAASHAADIFALGSPSLSAHTVRATGVWRGGGESGLDDKNGPLVPQEGTDNGKEKAGAAISDLSHTIIRCHYDTHRLWEKIHTLERRETRRTYWITNTQSNSDLEPETRTHRSPSSAHSNQDIFHYLNTVSGAVGPKTRSSTSLEVSKPMSGLDAMLSDTYGRDMASKTSEATALESETRTNQTNSPVFADLNTIRRAVGPKTRSNTSLEVSKPVSGLGTILGVNYGSDKVSKTSEAAALESETSYADLSTISVAVGTYPNPRTSRLEVSKAVSGLDTILGAAYGSDKVSKTSEVAALEQETRTNQTRSQVFADLNSISGEVVPKTRSSTSCLEVSKPVSGLGAILGGAYGSDKVSETSAATVLEPETRINQTHSPVVAYLNTISGQNVPKARSITSLEVSKPVSGSGTILDVTYGSDKVSKTSKAAALDLETRTKRSPPSTYPNQDIFHYLNTSSRPVGSKTRSRTNRLEVSNPVSGLGTILSVTYGSDFVLKTSEAAELEPETRIIETNSLAFADLNTISGSTVPNYNPSTSRHEVSKPVSGLDALLGAAYGRDMVSKTSAATVLEPETRINQTHSPVVAYLNTISGQNVPKARSITSLEVSKPVSGSGTILDVTYGSDKVSKTSKAAALDLETRTKRSSPTTHPNQDIFHYLNTSSGPVGSKTRSRTNRLEVSNPVSGLGTILSVTYGSDKVSKTSKAAALDLETRTKRSSPTTHPNQDIFYYLSTSSGSVLPKVISSTSLEVPKPVSGQGTSDKESKTSEAAVLQSETHSPVFANLNTISGAVVSNSIPSTSRLEVSKPVSGLGTILGVTYGRDMMSKTTTVETKTSTTHTNCHTTLYLNTISGSAFPKASSGTNRFESVSVTGMHTIHGVSYGSDMTSESTALETKTGMANRRPRSTHTNQQITQTHLPVFDYVNTFGGSTVPSRLELGTHLDASGLDTTYGSNTESVTPAALKMEMRTNRSPRSTHAHQDISNQMHLPDFGDVSTASGPVVPYASSFDSFVVSATELGIISVSSEATTLETETFSGPARSSASKHDSADVAAMVAQSTPSEPEITNNGLEAISVTPLISLFYGPKTFENASTTGQATHRQEYTLSPVTDIPHVVQANTQVSSTEYATDTGSTPGFTGTSHPTVQDSTLSSSSVLPSQSELPMSQATLAEFSQEFSPNTFGRDGEEKTSTTAFQTTSIPPPYDSGEQRSKTTASSTHKTQEHTTYQTPGPQITEFSTSNYANNNDVPMLSTSVYTNIAEHTSRIGRVDPTTPTSPSKPPLTRPMTTTLWTTTQQTPSHVPTERPRTTTPQSQTTTGQRTPITQMPWQQSIPAKTDKDWPPNVHVFVVGDQPAIFNADKFQVPLEVRLEGDSHSNVGLTEVEPFLRRLAGYQSQHVTWHSGPVIHTEVTFRTMEAVSWLGRAKFLLQEAGLRPLPKEGIFVGGVRVKNITVEGLQADICSWLFSCPPGFHCISSEGNASCRSVCHSQYCKHHGICVHRPGQQPLCQCPVGEDFWFMGPQCDLRMTRQRLAGVCFGVLAVVAVLMAILAYLAVRRFKNMLVQTKMEQTQSSYRRFNHFDELSARYWQKSWPGSEDSLENVTFSHSDEVLHLRTLDQPCCYHDDTLSIASTYPGSGSRLNTVYPHSSQYQWDMSTCSLADGVVDSGKASDLSVCSWPIEPIQWTPFPLLQQIRNTTMMKPSRSRSYCEGMEMVDMEKSRTA